MSVQFYLQIHRRCIVHNQLRIRKLSGPDVSCWTWDQGHLREYYFCFLHRFTTVDREWWLTYHFSLRRDDFNFQITNVTVLSSNIPFSLPYCVFYLSANTTRPGLLLVLMFHPEGQATFQLNTQTGIHRVLWSIRGSYSAIWNLPLTNWKWHSDPWPVTVTSELIRFSYNSMK